MNISQLLFEEVLIGVTQIIWDVSERSQSDLHWQSHLRDLSETSQKSQLFCNFFKMSQRHFNKDVVCVMSLRGLWNISKKMSIPWHLWDISKHFLQVFVIFQKYSTRMVSCDFWRVAEIFGYNQIKSNAFF